MAKLSIRDLDLKGKRAFIRVDFNVPVAGGAIQDDTRIRASLPTIRYALDRAASVILASHLGRPKGKPSAEFSLKPVATRLAELLGRPVVFAADAVGDSARAAVDEAGPGGVVLLENLRFRAAEEQNDPEFARALASLADVYVNDAFGTAHRAHASTEGMTRFVSQAATGLLMEAELRHLAAALESPERPFVAVLGGAKVSDKIEVMANLVSRVDALLIGGAMAYTFFRGRELPIGRSLVEPDRVAAARDVERQAAERRVDLRLPIDHVVADRIDAGSPHETLAIGDAAIGERLGVDIGAATAAAYAALIERARTIVWNGPMGVFEIEAFAAGTQAVAQAVARVRGTTIIGGGDSISAVTKAGVADRITHISTGGGASLEFLGGRVLPGVAALTDRS